MVAVMEVSPSGTYLALLCQAMVKMALVGLSLSGLQGTHNAPLFFDMHSEAADNILVKELDSEQILKLCKIRKSLSTSYFILLDSSPPQPQKRNCGKTI